jgi:hypothetical protein
MSHPSLRPLADRARAALESIGRQSYVLYLASPDLTLRT